MNKALTMVSTTTLFAALLIGPTANASAYAPCGTTVADKDGSSWPTATTDGVNMRTGSDTSCTSVGLLLQGQRADYHCYTVNRTYTWTFLRNVSTGQTGWVRDDFLPGYGSNVSCGF